MNPEAAQENQRIFAQVEGYGGGYVWEPEIFAVTMMAVMLLLGEKARSQKYSCDARFCSPAKAWLPFVMSGYTRPGVDMNESPGISFYQKKALKRK
jgi:hypothetical protein